MRSFNIPAAERVNEGVLRAPARGRRRKPPLVSILAALDAPARVLADRGWENPALLARAAAARQALVTARVGGAWWRGSPASALSAGGGGHALVALAEPAFGGAAMAIDDAACSALLDRALTENPAGCVVVLAATVGLRRLAAAATARGAVIIEQPCDPWEVIPGATRVYTVGGEIGFLALCAGVPVTVAGTAFYSGWGATDDAAAGSVPRHPFRRTNDEIFAAACLVATRYRNPFLDRDDDDADSAVTFEEALAIVADWRRLDDANRRIAVCVGMSFWKRRRIADFVYSSAGAPKFRRTVSGAIAAAAPAGPAGHAGTIAGWASRLPAGLEREAARRGVPLIRVEDGFIRSVGLGSDFLPPASLVFDGRGIYYDPRTASDLETLLRDAAFDPPMLRRAAALTTRLVARGVTKYNLGERGGGLPPLPPGRQRILVPGQVEDDLSIAYGAQTVHTNTALLAAVRAARPDAFIVYKPHPDVLAGHRRGAVPETVARRYADVVVTSAGSTAALLDDIDELHTMTSLAGFEALLRGRRVVVYGRPFYAGWGLTDDHPRIDRGRRLSLAELVAGALILYPRYLDPLTRLPCGPEIIVERLDRPELWRPGPLVTARRFQGLLARRLVAWRAALPAG